MRLTSRVVCLFFGGLSPDFDFFTFEYPIYRMFMCIYMLLLLVIATKYRHTVITYIGTAYCFIMLVGEIMPKTQTALELWKSFF